LSIFLYEEKIRLEDDVLVRFRVYSRSERTLTNVFTFISLQKH